MLCGVRTGVVPSGWQELCSWSLGKPHILSFGFRLQDSKFAVSPSDKTRSQTGKGKQARESRGTGSGEAMVPPGPHSPGVLCSCPGLLSPPRLEATPEPGRPLCKDLVQCQCHHLSREVGMLGCPRSPLPGPLPCFPQWRPETILLRYQSLSVRRLCCLCPQLPQGTQ